MSETEEWKEKYLSLADRQEQEAAAHAEAQTLLSRTIIRLTLAASGIDPTLDPILKKLRHMLRRGYDASLKTELDSLSDTLLRMGEPEEAEVAGDSSSDLLRRLLARAPSSGKDARRLAELSAQLLVDPAAATDEQLDELLALLTSGGARTGDAAGAKAGLFGWLFKQERAGPVAGAEAGASDSPNRVLLHLLEKLDWPGRMTADISNLKGHLESGDDAGAWVLALERLAKLVMEAFGDVQSEIQATESFLSDLTQRLHEIDDHISGGSTLREAALKSGQAFNRAVQGDMDGLRQTAHSATDLHQLQRDIAAHLDSIQQRIDTHIEDEKQRQRQAEETEQHLRQRLQSLEGEAARLHSKVAEVHHQALKDAVTGLPNRMAYEERLAHEVAVWRRNKSPLAMLVWDLDNFKQINDTYGHQAGDKVLRVIGRTLAERPRESDFVGRYGGEEFVMLLVGSPMEQVVQVAEQVREEVANQQFHSESKQRIAVTISCGISEFREGDTPEAVFQRADKALYQAKREGKNRCLTI
jgi:diguanylate cyclase